MKNFITVIIAILVIIFIGKVIFPIMEKRDAEIAAGADAYEKCVIEEYGMTIQTYYEANGEYPYCIIK